MGFFKNFQLGFISLLVAAGIGVGSCDSHRKNRYNSDLAKHLRVIDKDYDPQHELDLENKFGVNLLGYPEHIDAFANLIDTGLSTFQAGQLQDLEIYLEVPPSNNDGFARELRSFYFQNSSSVHLSKIDLTEIIHECVHHIDFQNEKTHSYHAEWNRTLVRWEQDGSWNQLSKAELYENADRFVKEDISGVLNSWHNNGFISSSHLGNPYYGAATPYGLEDAYEDRAEMTAAIKVLKINPFSSRLNNFPFYDSRLDPAPYFEHANFLKNHNFITSEEHDNLVSFLNQKLNEAQPVRNINWEDKSQLASSLINPNETEYDLGDNARLTIVENKPPGYIPPQNGTSIIEHSLYFDYTLTPFWIPLFHSSVNVKYEYENDQLKSVEILRETPLIMDENIDMSPSSVGLKSLTDKYKTFIK